MNVKKGHVESFFYSLFLWHVQTGVPPEGNTNRNQRTSGGSYNKNRSGKKRTSGKTTPKNTRRSTKRGSASPVIEISKLLVILWLVSSFLYAFLWK